MLCLLCGGSVRPLFSARDYHRPDDGASYLLHWCDRCAFGRLRGEFTPERVGRVTRPTTIRTERRTKQLRQSRLLIGFARILHGGGDCGTDFSPSELGPANDRSLCDIGSLVTAPNSICSSRRDFG